MILDHARVPHFASKVLGLVSRRLGADWQAAYGDRPVLLETFVETGRFAGTSYKAANWLHVGNTKSAPQNYLVVVRLRGRDFSLVPLQV